MMRIRKPRTDDRYYWTNHVSHKMRQYRISKNRIMRIIRHPRRIETGIVPHTVAVMQPADTKQYQELWVMYSLARAEKRENLHGKTRHSKIKVITAGGIREKARSGTRYPKRFWMKLKILYKIFQKYRSK